MPGPGETKQVISNPCLKVLTWWLLGWQKLGSWKTPIIAKEVDQ